jgi:hypothetical protein
MAKESRSVDLATIGANMKSPQSDRALVEPRS